MEGKASELTVVKSLRECLPVVEVFYSIQGEGITAGRPAVFLRLAFCNLSCIWCDSKFTWEVPVLDFQWQKFEEVASQIGEYPCRRLVITGGEPLVWQNRLVELLSLLSEHTVEVETNGTFLPHPDFHAFVSQYNVCPKLSNTGLEEEVRLKWNVLKFHRNSEKSYFKFVLVRAQDIHEVLSVVERLRVPPERVILIPEGTTQQQIALRRPFVAELCKKYGFLYSERLHILIWGNQRGV